MVCRSPTRPPDSELWSSIGDPDPGSAHAAVGQAEDDDQDHRQDHDEEEAHSVAEGPQDAHPGDLERFHAGTSAPRARMSPMAPVTQAHGHQDEDAGQDVGQPRRRDGQRVDRPQEPGMRGDQRDPGQDLGRLAQRDEDAADRRQAEGDDRVQAAGLLDRPCQRRDECRDPDGGDDRREDQCANQGRRPPAGVGRAPSSPPPARSLPAARAAIRRSSRRGSRIPG